MVKYVASTILLALIVLTFSVVRANETHDDKGAAASPAGKVRCHHH